MIKHIVMWQLKDYAEGSDKATNAMKMITLLDSCRDLVPGFLHLEISVAQPDMESTYDIVLYAEFSDKVALNAYLHHPQHKAIKAVVMAISSARQCMDYAV